MASLTIGQLAKRAGVNLDTVRYYERRRLLAKAPRSAGGYRSFSEETVKRLRFIRHAQQLGFTLKEIAELLSLQVDPETTCGDVLKRAEAKSEDIDKKISHLKAMKRALKRLMTECARHTSSKQCSLIEALQSEDGEILSGPKE